MASHAETAPIYSRNASILITGASSGIGAAIAEHLAGCGGRIALFARRAPMLEALAERLEQAGAKPLVLVGDVTDPEAVAAAYDAMVSAQGLPDVAFLNAGTGENQPLRTFEATTVKRIFDVNVFGAVHWLEHLLGPMIERQSGTLVGISSLVASRGAPASGAYCASKAALSVLLESLRVEAREHGIQVSTVEPGFVRSELTARNDYAMPMLMEAPEAARRICDGVAAGRPMIRFPWPVAAAVRLLSWLPIGIYDKIAIRALQRQGDAPPRTEPGGGGEG